MMVGTRRIGAERCEGRMKEIHKNKILILSRKRERVEKRPAPARPFPRLQERAG